MFRTLANLEWAGTKLSDEPRSWIVGTLMEMESYGHRLRAMLDARD
jgi:hypothetical protein